MTEIVYAIYLILTCVLTVWVAQTLYRSGYIFLIDAFHGDATMASSVNHLLRVGFYLVNLGFVALFLSVGNKPDSVVSAVEYISSKVGVVMLVLGLMHFFNMFNISKMRRRAKRSEEAAAVTRAAPLPPSPAPIAQPAQS